MIVKQWPADFTGLVTIQSRRPITRTNHRNVRVNKIPAAIITYSRICMVQTMSRLSHENWVGLLAQFFNFCTIQLNTMVLTLKIMTSRSRAAANPKIFSGRFRFSSRVRKI